LAYICSIKTVITELLLQKAATNDYKTHIYLYRGNPRNTFVRQRTGSLGGLLEALLRGFSHGGNIMLQKTTSVQVNLVPANYKHSFVSRLLRAIRNPLFYVSSFKGSSLPWGTYFRCGEFNPCQYHFVRTGLFYFEVFSDGHSILLAYNIFDNEID